MKNAVRLTLLTAFFGLALQAASIIQFPSTAYYASEGISPVEITIQRTNDLDTVVSVDFTTTNMTARAGLDYTAVTMSVSFAMGETNRTIAIPILNDDLVESEETFRLLLGNPTGGAQLGARATAMVRIADNDTGLAFEFPGYWVREDEGPVQIGVVRGDDGDFPITVDVKTANSSAQAGLDYTGITNTLSFAAGERIKLFTVPALNDGIKEANETFRLLLSNPTGGAALGSPTVATVTVVDNDPGIGFFRLDLAVHEDQGAVSLTVLRGNDQLLGPFQVEYTVANLGTTTAEDHDGVSGVIGFTEGQMSQMILIPIVCDTIEEPDEWFQVKLSNPTGGMALGTAAATTAKVRICDVTGMQPNRFASIERGPDGVVRIGLTAQTHTRFLPYYSLFPLETSSDLRSWEHAGLMALVNASDPKVVLFEDPTSAIMNRCFYRLAQTNLIAPCMPPTGPYAVGKVRRLLTDPTRRNRFQVSTNGSFMLHVWYPAVPQAGRMLASHEDEPLLSDPWLWGGSTWLDRVPRFAAYSFLDAPVLQSNKPYPILLYSHGGGGDNHNSCQELYEHLASHGYVVVAMDHWDAVAFVWQDGTYFERLGDVTLDAEGLADRVRDLMLVVDELGRLNQTDPLLSGVFDLRRVAAAGFSWGGPTAGEFCRVDSRCLAAIAFDGGRFEDAPELVRLGLQKPLLMLNRTDNTDQTLFGKATTDAYWAQVTAMVHNDFSYAYWWSSPGSVTSRREAWQAMHPCVLSFLNRYLKGQNDGLLDGNLSQAYPRLVNFKRK